MDIGIAARRCYGVYMKWILGRMRWYLDSNWGRGWGDWVERMEVRDGDGDGCSAFRKFDY